MKICFKVSAQELLNAGAPLNVIRQSYREYEGFKEKVNADGDVYYMSSGTSKELYHYIVPAKAMDGGKLSDAKYFPEGATLKLVYGGSIKDSYVLIS